MSISPFTHAQFEALLAKFAPQAKLLHVRPLTGGYSAQIVAFGYRLADERIAQAVLRLHGEIDLIANPNIAADEFRLMQVLSRAGLPVPEPIYLDAACDIFAVPCLVIGFVDGQPDFTPADVPATVRQMAAQLAALHQIRAENKVAFLPRQAEICAIKLHSPPDVLDHSLSEDCIRAALVAAWPWAQPNANAILHGDYWPGNVLWRDGQLLSVIDWEDAAFGDPLADLANTRLEVLWAFGEAAMQLFTATYRAAHPQLDLAALPYWDLVAALRPCNKIGGWGLAPATERIMRQSHRSFVDAALGIR